MTLKMCTLYILFGWYPSNKFKLIVVNYGTFNAFIIKIKGRNIKLLYIEIYEIYLKEINNKTIVMMTPWRLTTMVFIYVFDFLWKYLG